MTKAEQREVQDFRTRLDQLAVRANTEASLASIAPMMGYALGMMDDEGILQVKRMMQDLVGD